MIRSAIKFRAPAVAIVLACCLYSQLPTAEALPGPIVKSAVTPAIRTAEMPPKASGFPGYWAQANCSFKEELATFFMGESWLAASDGIYNSNGEGNVDTCLVIGGGLTVRDEGRVNDEPGSGPIYVYKAPTDSTIAGGVMTWTFKSPGGIVYVSSPANNIEAQNVIATCNGCAPEKETIGLDKVGGTALYIGATCTAAPGKTLCSSEGINAEASAQSVTIMLHNQAKPTASGIAGTLLDDPTSGTASLSFTAFDKQGPGVYRIVLAVDGVVVSSFTPDENESRCVPFGTYDQALVFESAQPCPQTTGVSAEIPTPSFTDGQHLLTATVEDAAGNSSVVYEHTITVANHPAVPVQPIITPSLPLPTPPSRGPANGAPASESALISISANQPKTFTETLAHAAVTLKGRLTDPTGTPIKDAQLQLLQQVVGSPALTHTATTTTHSDGTWTLKVPAGPSRLLRVAYFSHLLDSAPAATLDFRERVLASMSLHAPRRVSLGQEFSFTGRLAGGYIPQGGEAVQLKIFYHGHWRTLEVIDTNPRGEWSYRYGFSLEPGTSWSFKAVPLPNGTYPFMSDESPIRRVTIRR